MAVCTCSYCSSPCYVCLISLGSLHLRGDRMDIEEKGCAGEVGEGGGRRDGGRDAICE